MANEVTIRDSNIVEQVVLHGDLAELNPADRVDYYARVCESLGLNPFTRPFEFIKLNNKLTLYARRDATDQLRAIKNVSIQITSRELIEGIYIVSAKATCGTRVDESIGAVDIANLKGEIKANAIMKAETKAKRRVTLSIVGLGWLDETEVQDIPPKDIQRVNVNMNTGEIIPTIPPTPQNEQGAEKPPEVVDKSQHWCSEHNCAFREYSKGDKKWYSHNIGDKWCNEKKESEKKPVKKEIQEDQPPLTDDLFK